MDFSWAFNQVKEGHKIRRAAWSRDVYLFVKKQYIWVSHPRNQDEFNSFNISDFEAIDWEIYEEPKETLSDKVKDAEPQDNEPTPCYEEEDIKEFIKQVKAIISSQSELDYGGSETALDINEKINELLGDRFK